MTVQKQRYDDTTLPMPTLSVIPTIYRERIEDLFDTWHHVRSRNATLTRYYEMKNTVRDLGIAIPPQLSTVNEVVGWCHKAVSARSVRSRFDGFVFNGQPDPNLDALTRANKLRRKVSQATNSMLVHGLSFMTVMRGALSQPKAVVRAFSANQACALWDKDTEDIACGIVVADVDRYGKACKYVAHFPDAVLTFTRLKTDTKNAVWDCLSENHKTGRPLMVSFVHDPDIDKPLGHSILTPELLSITDKAVRDVLRMDVGAEFFTAPQRYALGVAEDMFSVDGEPEYDEEGNEKPRAVDEAKKLRAYLGALWAFTRDENGEVPTVGQFPAGDAENFIAVYENDAQRFSGAAHIPLAQLGVLSNNYTSSDALGAANDPLILDVETMNERLRESLYDVAQLMMAISQGKKLSELTDEQNGVMAYFADPSMPTLAARADGWAKIGSSDKGIIGTRVWYEGLGLPQATIDRLISQRQERGAIEALNIIAEKAAGNG